MRVRCQDTSKMHDVKSKDNHKICTQVVVHLLKGMYELTLNLPSRFLKTIEAYGYKFTTLRRSRNFIFRLNLNFYCVACPFQRRQHIGITMRRRRRRHKKFLSHFSREPHRPASEYLAQSISMENCIV